MNRLSWMDYISPSAWIMKGFDLVLGFDPIQEVQNKIFGDWETLARMPEVLDNASTAVHDVAINIQSGATVLQGCWQGNAGEAAYRYFTDLATSVDGLRLPLGEMGAAYRTMADAVWSVGDALGGLLKGMCDAALIAGLAVIGGTATAASGVGLGIGYGIAAIESTIILKHWAEATKLLAYANAAIMGFRAVLNRELSNLDSVKLPVIGGGAGYDHPLAGAGAHA
ncbi:WXG100 family type VII secretion target [Actinoplanes sp. GCM10030250]|uniref:WXG100 family type VII secretion target n=1 Tax=Actinoplanes sp. GCM10030250 TaxID=3273376 RepID=UPI0036155C3E